MLWFLLAVLAIPESDIPPALHEPISPDCLISMVARPGDSLKLRDPVHRLGAERKARIPSSNLVEQTQLLDRMIALHAPEALSAAMDTARDMQPFRRCFMLERYPDTPGKQAVMRELVRLPWPKL